MGMGRWRAAAVAVAFTLAGCGGDDEATATATTERTTTTVRRTTTTRPTTTTTAPPLTVAASDPVVADCDDGQVEIKIAKPAETETLRTVYSVNVPNALQAVGLEGGYISDCSSRAQFNQDFSAMILVGDLADTGTDHAVHLDLRSGKATDLTAPRQRSGFSGGEALEESPLMFEPAGVGLVVGSRVVVSSGTQMLLVDPANPAGAQPAPLGYDAYDDLRSFASGIDYCDDCHHGRSILSPDGRFRLSDGSGAPGYIARVGTNDEAARLPYECSGFPEGWRDAHTAVVSGDDNYYLVPVDDNGTPGACTPIFPAADRDFTFARLRLDGQALYVTVAGASGDEHYVADLANPGAEPAPQQPRLVMEANWRIYHPRTA